MFRYDRKVPSSALSLVTKAEAKKHLRVEHSEDDELIGTLIQTAYELAEQLTNQLLQRETVTCYADSFRQCMLIKLGVDATVDSVKYIDTDGSEQTLDATDYDFDGRSYPSRLEIINEPSDVRDRMNSVIVEVTSGFSLDGVASQKTPSQFKNAILLIVGHLYENRQDVTAFKAHEIPMSSQYLLNPFRRSTMR